MGKIIHIEVTTPDIAAGAEFFTAAFGWTTTASPFVPGYLLAATGSGSGIDGAIMSRDHQDQRIIAWIEVADIVTSLAAVVEHGGRTIGDIHDLPGQGRVAYFSDPAGTVWGLRQP